MFSGKVQGRGVASSLVLLGCTVFKIWRHVSSVKKLTGIVVRNCAFILVPMPAVAEGGGRLSKMAGMSQAVCATCSN